MRNSRRTRNRSLLAALFLFAAGLAAPAAADIDAIRQALDHGDAKSTFLRLRTLAINGGADAQHLLGDLYFRGRSTYQNMTMAFHWYERAAVQGDAEAQYRVGYMFEHGMGAPLYREKAIEWYGFAAKQGHLASQIRWGLLHGPTDPVALRMFEKAARGGSLRAVRLLREASAQGSWAARVILARMPGDLKGETGPAPPSAGKAADRGLAAFLNGDYETAMAVFKPLADKGDPGGLFGIGLFYQLGKAFRRDLAKATRFFRAAAKKGHAGARLVLKQRRRMGNPGRGDRDQARIWLQNATDKGITAFRNGDYETAMAIFKPLADRGDPSGLFGLGLFYDTGRGLLRNAAKAATYYRAAAEKGYRGAQVNLANMYLRGEGMDRDPARAMSWYRKAAAEGDTLAQNMLGLAYFLARGVPRDEQEASTWLRRAAAHGSPKAANSLAVLRLGRDAAPAPEKKKNALLFYVGATTGYVVAENGLREAIRIAPVKKDSGVRPREARERFETAAENGNADAQSNLGQIYRGRYGADKDLVQAYKWFSLAMNQDHPYARKARALLAGEMSAVQVAASEWLVAETLKSKAAPPPELVDAGGGSPDAQRELGKKYQYGVGVEKDEAEAAKWYLKAARQGDTEAQRLLGHMYRRGLGVSRSDDEAAKWFRAAAEQGFAKAQRDLGIMYQFGKGVPQDDVEAVKWYLKAAEQGDAKAQSNLAFMYKVARGTPKDYKAAAKWYRAAAEQGSSRAQKNLGVLYQMGHGVPQDDDEAVKWYFRAAQQGRRSAQANLGFMYKAGRGVSRDYEEAAKWYAKAARQGLARAQNVLGLMYWEGKGVDESDSQTVEWFLRAIKQGHRKAQENLDRFVKEGRGSSKDFEAVAKYYLSAANEGDPRAQNSLGLLYHYGKGVDRNPKEAKKWYQAAIKGGITGAQQNLNAMRAGK
ncbi:MAG: tetratricopeptide repeat protein [Rhodospirillales bacterium]